MVRRGVAIITASAAAMTKKPPAASHAHNEQAAVQMGSHQRAAYDGVDIPL